MADAKLLLKQLEKKKNNRSIWDDHFDDLAKVMLPTRRGFVTMETPGEERTEDIYDGTPMQAARSLANAIGSMLRSEKMFFIKTNEGIEDNDDEAKAWLEDSRKRLYKAIMNPRARFLQSTGEVDLDLVVFGTGVLYIGENAAERRLEFRSKHLKDTFIGISENGSVDKLDCEYHWSVRQAVQKFKDKAGSYAKKHVEKDPDKNVCYVQCVFPRGDYKVNGLLAKDMPTASVWIEKESQEIILESGFNEFPFVVPRWDTASGETYGRSPGMIALPDSNTLQAVGETLLMAGQRSADPALLFPDDGIINPGQTAPGGISYYDAAAFRGAGINGNPIFPMPSGTNMPLTLEMQNGMRDQIFNAYFRNVFNLPIDGPQMTATEVIERKEQFIREIGAVFGRLESDYTGPMIERSFGIMLRNGGFAPIPQSLAGREVVFEYDSPVNRARRQIEGMAAQLWLQDVGQAAEFDPGVIDNFDGDAYVKFVAEARGVPSTILASSDKVEAKRQARAQQQQMEQMASMAERAADVAGKLPEGALEELAQ